MKNIRKGGQSIHQLHAHLVWSIKYRNKVLRGEVPLRYRDLIRQGCDSLDIQILKGVISKHHVHLYLSNSPQWSVSDIIKRLKGCRAKSSANGAFRINETLLGGHVCRIGYALECR